jgi:solute carrier family 25, member 44
MNITSTNSDAHTSEIAKSKRSSSNKINDIQWYMLDRRKYFPLTIINMFGVRTLLYPLSLVRTRLQVQARGSLYKGTIHALRTVAKYEGFSGLYKGFWVNSFHLVPHVIYITSYEVNIFFLSFCFISKI